MDQFQLRLTNQDADASLIALIRKHTRQSLGQIREALIQGRPILDVSIHHNTYDEFIASMIPLMDSLESSNVDYQCTVDGVVESSQYVRNVFLQWGQIVKEQEDSDDRRFSD